MRTMDLSRAFCEGHLFQAIECLFQLQDFVLLAFSLKTLWLFHVELLIKLSIEEGSLDINATHVPL